MNTTQIRDRSDFAIVVPSFLDEYGLDPMEYRLYSHIVRRAGKDGCFESIPNMAKICLMNEKTVRKALRVLIASGLIKIAQERKGKTTIYEIAHSSEWVHSQQLNAIRQQFTTNKVNQNLIRNSDTPSIFGSTNNGTTTKSGRGSGSKSGRGVVPNQVGVVVPNQAGVVVPDLVDEVYPINNTLAKLRGFNACRNGMNAS
jgi:predicted transcriptional regulator